MSLQILECVHSVSGGAQVDTAHSSKANTIHRFFPSDPVRYYIISLQEYSSIPKGCSQRFLATLLDKGKAI